MTLERLYQNEPTTLDQKIEFVYGRVNRFHNAARMAALKADKIMADAEEAFRAEYEASVRNRTKYPAFNGQRDTDLAWISRQYQIATTSADYKNAVADNQMYDRWTMREATVLQALCSYRDYTKAKDRHMQDVEIPAPRFVS